MTGTAANRLALDVLERSGWTGAQAALGILIADLADLPLWWAAPAALLLTSAKGWIASRIGNKDTASTLPASKDPATPPPAGTAPYTEAP